MTAWFSEVEPAIAWSWLTNWTQGRREQDACQWPTSFPLLSARRVNQFDAPDAVLPLLGGSPTLCLEICFLGSVSTAALDEALRLAQALLSHFRVVVDDGHEFYLPTDASAGLRRPRVLSWLRVMGPTR